MFGCPSHEEQSYSTEVFSWLKPASHWVCFALNISILKLHWTEKKAETLESSMPSTPPSARPDTVTIWIYFISLAGRAEKICSLNSILSFSWMVALGNVTVSLFLCSSPHICICGRSTHLWSMSENFNILHTRYLNKGDHHQHSHFLKSPILNIVQNLLLESSYFIYSDDSKIEAVHENPKILDVDVLHTKEH